MSEQTLTTWQRAGMPSIERGRRGHGNAYDVRAVVRWVRDTGRSYDRTTNRYRVDLDALERELGLPPPAVEACAKDIPDERAIARAIALARVSWLDELPSWDYEIPPSELAELVGLFIGQLEIHLAAAGLRDVQRILEASFSARAFPDGASFEDLIAQCRAEIPRLPEKEKQPHAKA